LEKVKPVFAKSIIRKICWPACQPWSQQRTEIWQPLSAPRWTLWPLERGCWWLRWRAPYVWG